MFSISKGFKVKWYKQYFVNVYTYWKPSISQRNILILTHLSLVFSRSGVCSINCWPLQERKIVRFKRGFWAIRRFSSGTSFWSGNHGNLDVDCATEDSGKVWNCELFKNVQDGRLYKNENNGPVNTAIWNFIVFSHYHLPTGLRFHSKVIVVTRRFRPFLRKWYKCSTETRTIRFQECSPKKAWIHFCVRKNWTVAFLKRRKKFFVVF